MSIRPRSRRAAVAAADSAALPRDRVEALAYSPTGADRSAERDTPLGSPSRPTWRGRLHLFALFTALPLLVHLAVIANGARARAAVIVYAVGLCSMLAVSTTYHRWVHTVHARRHWRRADHATIFAAIAGTFTAVGLITLPTGWAIVLLIAIWTAAVVGAAVKIVDVHGGDRIGVVMYITTGWAGLLLVPALWARGPIPLALVLAGGAAYTIGAIGFSRKWPTLRPSTFSYHEVWHAFTVVAAGAHLAAVWTIATT